MQVVVGFDLFLIINFSKRRKTKEKRIRSVECDVIWMVESEKF
jgi:hypothetical protein